LLSEESRSKTTARSFSCLRMVDILSKPDP
jgi:hypothetical protein